MKSALYLIAICFICLLLIEVTGCLGDEELYFTHLYGWMKRNTDSVGVNGLVLQIRDINPENTSSRRIREAASGFSSDSLPGFFEVDSVCYGTSQIQGSDIVCVMIDSVDNPGTPTQIQSFDLNAPVDTIDFYFTP